VSAGPAARDDLRTLLDRLTGRPADPRIAEFAGRLAARPGVLAVLFYGAELREPRRGGLLDLYLLTEGDARYHGPGLSALANRLLPPNVYHERAEAPGPLAAKVAVMRLSAFRSRMRRQSLDTTLWARFCQPCVILCARDAQTRAAVLQALAAAGETAAWWAARLAPAGADAETCWRALFAHTYGAELRVEGRDRAQAITAAAPELYALLHARHIAGRRITDAERASARRGWALRRVLGKALNLARLLKAAATFRGGIAYALDKVERHSGAPVPLSPWQRRLPLLAAPVILLRLLRERRLR